MGFFKNVFADLKAIRERDPAVSGRMEAFFCYPGFHALICHRIAHRLYRWKLRLIPRIMNTLTRLFTGVDIHPGATIGKGVFIDHAHGVVIGETAIVGDNVTILHQVTLGGTGKEHGKRHPTIEDGVLIGAGAKILGNVTIGKNSKIGSGSVVVRDVPPNCTVVGNPGRVVRVGGERVPSAQMDSASLPDPILDMFKELDAAIRKHHTVLEANKALPKVIGELRRDILKEICDTTRIEVGKRKTQTPSGAFSGPGPGERRGFFDALTRPGLSLIAEYKRKSPSAGDIRPDASVTDIVTIYEKEGAAAISVLTDTMYFGGSLDDLIAARKAVNLPVLRKDFIIDPYQIEEAYHAGANAILLIVAALKDTELGAFLKLANDYGMNALVESHHAVELQRALDTGAKIIGINNRDLRTMTTNIQTGIDLIDTLPDSQRAGRVFVAESGIKTRDDAIRIANAGFDAVLIGESFMKAEDIGAAVRGIMGDR